MQEQSSIGASHPVFGGGTFAGPLRSQQSVSAHTLPPVDEDAVVETRLEVVSALLLVVPPPAPLVLPEDVSELEVQAASASAPSALKCVRRLMTVSLSQG